MLAKFIRNIVPPGIRPIGYLMNRTYARTGGRVRAGPFAGLRYPRNSFGSCYIPKLLGIYERELYPAIEQACAAQPELIIDIGAAEGYYAVGLALRNPRARVVAFEMEERGREILRQTVSLNEKQAAVEIRGKCEPADLQQLLADGRRTYVVCDCEGYERVLLDPAAVPGLAGAQILVETHDFMTRGLTEELMAKFAATHVVERIWQTDRSPAEYPFGSLYLSLLPGGYRRWAVSEWRPERMSWLWMVPRGEGK
jgi:hypothetical protein